MPQKTLLIITDGIGSKPPSPYNAFHLAEKPAYKRLFDKIPYGMLATHGLSVGLPEGQMGNSEVGHMSLGSGRVLYQDLVRISLALENGELAKNSALLGLVKQTERIHLIGLASDGGVHSHISHILGVAKILTRQGKRVLLHLITDGRDVTPTCAARFLEEVEHAHTPNMKIATLSGRYYAMDRDQRWDRVEKAFRSIALGEAKTTLAPLDYIKARYAAGEEDEFITPCAFGGYDGFQAGDGVIFANFRSDRAREMVTALADPHFRSFTRPETYPLPQMVTLAPYDATFPYPVLFPKETIRATLAQTLSESGLSQLHIAETEKYAHVTFFFNGGIEAPWPKEERILIPSPTSVTTYDQKPEMSAPEVMQATLEGIRAGYDFIVVNFANGDMVGHTGNLKAAILAVEAVDQAIGKLLKEAKENGYATILTSDHGNCEEMADAHGGKLTNHTVGEVWCFVDAEGVKRVSDGRLSQVAPTILKLMGIQIPKEMDSPLI